MFLSTSHLSKVNDLSRMLSVSSEDESGGEMRPGGTEGGSGAGGPVHLSRGSRALSDSTTLSASMRPVHVRTAGGGRIGTRREGGRVRPRETTRGKRTTR